METTFDSAFDFLLRWEGEVSNHPDDPGGLTIYGLSAAYHPTDCKRAYEAFKSGQIELAQKIAKGVYRDQYWVRSQGYALPPLVGIALFDGAVNLGVKRSVRLLQKSLRDLGHLVDLDGLIGPQTIKAANQEPQGGWLFDRMCLNRMGYYAQKVNQEKQKRVFLRGWLARVLALADLGRESD